MRKQKIELYNDHFQNYKSYQIPKAQLVIADIPYNLSNNAYASSPQWYVDGDNKNGESKLANKEFFDTDKDFRIAEFMHFCSKMLIKEPKEKGKAPAMIVFCAFEQMSMVKEYGEKYGFMHSYPLFFIKNYSAQVLKSNMKIVGATEQAVVLHREVNSEILELTENAVVLYREKLPKFNNNGKMIFNWMKWEKDNSVNIIHPTQKPIPVLKNLIEIFTDIGDIVIDPVAGSCSTGRACAELNRSCYLFEIKKEICKKAREQMLNCFQPSLFTMDAPINKKDNRVQAGMFNE